MTDAEKAVITNCIKQFEGLYITNADAMPLEDIAKMTEAVNEVKGQLKSLLVMGDKNAIRP